MDSVGTPECGSHYDPLVLASLGLGKVLLGLIERDWL